VSSIRPIEVVMNRAGAAGPTVKLAELFPPESIRVGLDQTSKPDVIGALVHHAAHLGGLPGEAERPIVETILARERLGSTALGHGIAFPHCRWRPLDHPIGVVGLLRQPIPFDAADGEPVDRVFLTLTPAEVSEQSFDALGRLISIGRNKTLRLLLSGCRTAEHVSALLAELDQPVVGQLDELAQMAFSRPERDQVDRRRELGYLGLVQQAPAASDRKGRGHFRPRWF
jgi:nitrogen PTS system EIIA component